jgi:hypothetical protein
LSDAKDDFIEGKDMGRDRSVEFMERVVKIEAMLLDFQRSIAKTAWWVRFAFFVLHLTIPLSLGALAVLMVGEGAWAALSGLF